MGCKGSQVQILSPRPNLLGSSGNENSNNPVATPLFLEQYKLEANPFVPDGARPVFASHSMRYAALKLE